MSKTINVGSHLDKIRIRDAHVPIGFLASFHRKYHPCRGGRGFVLKKIGGKTINAVCACAVPRAIKRLNTVGKTVFEEQARAWEEKERADVRKSEETCYEEGKKALAEAKKYGKIGVENTRNPYPQDSDQNLAWQLGFENKELSSGDTD